MKKIALLIASAAALLMATGCAYDDNYHSHHNRGDWHHGNGDDNDNGDGDGGHHHRDH